MVRYPISLNATVNIKAKNKLRS